MVSLSGIRGAGNSGADIDSVDAALGDGSDIGRIDAAVPADGKEGIDLPEGRDFF